MKQSLLLIVFIAANAFADTKLIEYFKNKDIKYEVIPSASVPAEGSTDFKVSVIQEFSPPSSFPICMQKGNDPEVSGCHLISGTLAKSCKYFTAVWTGDRKDSYFKTICHKEDGTTYIVPRS